MSKFRAVEGGVLMSENNKQAQSQLNTQKGYSSSYGTEKERLLLQANFFQEIDRRHINYTLGQIKDNNKVNILDIGCAQGYLTLKHFSQRSDLNQVIGVDVNGESILDAKNNSREINNINFYVIDLESETFEKKIKRIMEKHNISNFDYIFGAYIIQHLNDPQKVLHKLYRLIRKGGFIHLRTSDDGSKICYPDRQKLFQNIISSNLKIKGMSNRQSGRELYNQLTESGFNNIEIKYNVVDTINKNKEEKEILFQIQFLPRLHIVRKLTEIYPESDTLKAQVKWLDAALKNFKTEFINNDNFYYSETIYTALAQKPSVD